MGVGESQIAQLLREQAAEVLLLLGGRAGGRGCVGLGVDADVTQETVKNGMREDDGQDGGSGFDRHTRA